MKMAEENPLYISLLLINETNIFVLFYLRGRWGVDETLPPMSSCLVSNIVY